MRIQSFYQVSPSVERAVIINVATEVVTSLAIASALRNLQMPVLVVNCTSEGVNKAFMDTLRDEWNFDLIDLPLTVHGVMIDRIFREVAADRITLVDSDAEVLNADVMKRVRAAFDNDRVYGAGYVHQSDWLNDDNSSMHINGHTAPVLYAERPWIPFATFRSSYIRYGLDNGATFREVYRSGGLVIDPAVAAKGQALIMHGDTGADMHAFMTNQGYHFDGPPPVADDAINHYHGVSRSALAHGNTHGTPLDKIENEVLAKLRNEYDPYWNGFAAAVKAAQG